MTNKKLEAKRLVIFLLLAFGITWIPAIILNIVFGFNDWFISNKVPFLVIPVLYGPAIANVLTRMITHEGWHDSMLHLRLKGNVKYYLIAIIAVVAMAIGKGVITTAVYGNGDFSEAGGGLNGLQIASELLVILSYVPLMAFNTFGEEFGWRAYMNQKLEPLLGTTGTVVVGGIIWGLWHAELTVVGHNFGTDYPGYPYTGILFMCIYCTFVGMGLMWLTKKTGSIYPAAIMHAAVNFSSNSIAMLLISGLPKDFDPHIKEELVMSIPFFVISSVFMVLLLINSSKKSDA